MSWTQPHIDPEDGFNLSSGTFSDLVDPFATHEPDLTPDEWVAIRDEIREHTFGDPSLLPDCLVEAVKVLGEIGTSNTPNPARAATQCLRRLAYRAKTGVPFHEPQEPAWSLDSERGGPR